jgi:hypothetical protein
MNDRITIEGRDGPFGSYIARPKALPPELCGPLGLDLHRKRLVLAV